MGAGDAARGRRGAPGGAPARRRGNPDRLWCSYQRSGDARQRERLILTFAPIVKYLAHRQASALPAHCDVDDLISAGLVAVIGAIDRYRPSASGGSLEQFVWTRARGAIIDELRRLDWAPRRVRRFAREVDSTERAWCAERGRGPTREELAAALGIDVAGLESRRRELASANQLSLNEPIDGDGAGLIERIDTIACDREEDPLAAALRAAERDHVEWALEELPERERTVAVLLYVHGLNLTEAGDVLGVSPSRVSQIHGALKRRLRELLSYERSPEPLLAA